MVEKVSPKKIGGVHVWCRYDKIVKIDTLKVNNRNPNKHPEKQVRLLAANIIQKGWRHPITISNRSGLIVTGHGRLLAAKAANLTDIPVEFQDYKNEADEWHHLISDNTIQELSEININELNSLIKDLKFTSADIAIIGVDIKLDGELDVELSTSAGVMEKAFEAGKGENNVDLSKSKEVSEPEKFPLTFILTAEEKAKWDTKKGSLSDKKFLLRLIND